MNEVKSVKRCYSCGAVLQSEDKKARGYIDEAVLNKFPDAGVIFCESCFEERKYSLSPKEASISDDFHLMLEDAKKSQALILYIIDAYSFECSFNSQVVKAIEGLPIVVLANKRDLLPSSINDEDLCEYVAHRFRVAGIRITKEDVFLASFSLGEPLEENLLSILDIKRSGKDIYLLGPKQGGKSFFISLFLRHYHNESGRNISTKEYPGTSLSLIDIPLDANSSIYDTPGTGIDNSFISFKDGALQKAIALKKEVERRNFAVLPDQAMAIGGVARIDNLGDKKIKFAAYFPDAVELNRVYANNKEERWEKLIKRVHKGNKIICKVTPSLESVQKPIDMDAFDFSFDSEQHRDIGIAGLGWVSFISYPGLKLRLYVPKGIGVYGSRSKMKGAKE